MKEVLLTLLTGIDDFGMNQLLYWQYRYSIFSYIPGYFLSKITENQKWIIIIKNVLHNADIKFAHLFNQPRQLYSLITIALIIKLYLQIVK